MKKIRNNRNQFEKSKTFKVGDSVNNVNTNSEEDNPVFCFKYLYADSLKKCSSNDITQFVKKLHRLSQLSWNQIHSAQRHGLGCEKIPRHCVSDAGCPPHLTADISFLVFRFDGLAPMIGYRSQRIFHIIWLDRDFTLYKH